MSLLLIVLICAALLWLAYRLYGSFLSRIFRLDPNAQTPAVTLRDDVDYVPISPRFLLSQHFSAIAAAGPIVGPIVAAVMFGWVPALIWILIGSIFIGGVHDMGALVASIRHKARSIAEVVRENMTRRSYVLFLLFVWITLVYIIVAFTDIVSSSFVGALTLENGLVVSGTGIATSSMLYLMLPIIMGLLMRYARLSVSLATVIFLPLVGVAIWAGQYIPLDLATWFGISDGEAQKIWDVFLLAYCFVASLIPMWLLLQPRGHLGGYFLFAALIGGALGILFGGKSVEYPAFTGWIFQGSGAEAMPLFPLLFITIACGACSGFHSIVASGTTSKQLRRETDARLIGYGGMLLEGMVAVVSVGCVMMLSASAGSALMGKPNFIYAQGIGSFLKVIGIPVGFGIAFGLLAFTTFVYDTLDVCTRLGRYIFQELTGWQSKLGRVIATLITAFVPLYFVLQTALDAAGRLIPAWRIFWPLFGASNQLLAALALLGVSVWLYRTHRLRRVWLISGLPTLFMYFMSSWALLRFIAEGFLPDGFVILPTSPVPWVALILVVLAILLLIEAFRVFLTARPKEAKAVPVTA
ncbi:MAG: carbon starvation protein A [bacterium]